MSKLIGLTDGHGLETPGKRTPVFPDGTVMRENEFNDAIMRLTAKELQRCGFRTYFPSPERTDTSLSVKATRLNNANVDINICFHANAYKGVWGDWGGISVFYSLGSTKGKKLAELALNELIKGTGLRNRGFKTTSLYMTGKHVKAPSILCECGFMDNLKEAALLRTYAYRLVCAEAVAKAVCKYFGVKYIEEDKKEISNALKLGAKGEEVKELQLLLNKFYNLGLVIDGSFGPKTDAAVRYAQEDMKIDIDGSVGPQTKAALEKRLKEVENDAIKENMKDAKIKALQAFLNSFGYKGKDGKELVLDSLYGPNTSFAHDNFSSDIK